MRQTNDVAAVSGHCMIWCRSGEGCRSYACSAHSEHLVHVRVSQTKPSRITTVGALRIDIWIASRQLASHRVQSVTFRVHECPDLMKTTLRKSLEKIARKTRKLEESAGTKDLPQRQEGNERQLTHERPRQEKEQDLCLMSRTLPTEQLTRPVQQ